MIQQADSLESSGRFVEAQNNWYIESQTTLLKFQKANPNWNTQVIAFRLEYSREKSPTSPVVFQRALRQSPLPLAIQPAPGTIQATPGKINSQTELDTQLSDLKDQVRQYRADKMVLEAKLKESLSVQPAAVDSRELVKAEEKIKNLQKETDLLKYTLSQEKARRVGAVGSQGNAQQALTGANRKLAEQTERANTLELEKTALQSKLNSLAPSTWNAAALETTKHALEEANRQIAEQKQINSRLVAEKEALENRLKNVASNPAADAEALRTRESVAEKGTR